MSMTSLSTMNIQPISQPISGRVRVPGSKSQTNRTLMVAALADGTTKIHNALFSDDSHYFAEALRILGFDIQLDPQTKTMTLTGQAGHIPSKQANLLIGNAGTAARFLTAMLTLGHGEYHLDGVKRMRQRPIMHLVTALNKLGAQIEAASGCPPVHIHARGLAGGTTSVHGNVSSQFLSGLLMAAPYAQTSVDIEVQGPLHSKPYIDLTLGVMADFGVQVQREGYLHFHIDPQAYSAIEDYPIESDASAASYFFAAAALCGGWLEVDNLTPKTRQGDLAFLDILSEMGCIVTHEGNAMRISSRGQLKGVDVDMADISDTSMTLGAIAPFANSPTTIRGIASSRLKETDRVAATCCELSRLGVRVEEHSDGMTIYPCTKFRSTQIHTYDDHRIAMAFALVGLRVPGVAIENSGCVAKTFPDYFEVLETLR
jgi:3-phosphoshikimate 1-carboxyvinyltransferase